MKRSPQHGARSATAATRDQGRGFEPREIPKADVRLVTSDDSFASFFAHEAKGQVQRATLLLGSFDEANDVVQEAMTKLYQRWDSVDDPGPYLNRSVLNLCRDRGRRRSAEIRAIAELSSQKKSADAARSTSNREILDDVLADLPFQHRAAVVLRYWGGLSFDEIATELDCSAGSVGPWINRALKTIKEVLS